MTDTSVKHRGAKYDAALSPVEVAKLFRKDLKAAEQSGNVPKGMKVFVRTERGRSIRVSVERCPGILMLNPAYFLVGELNLQRQPRLNRFTREFQVVLQHIEDMLAAYQLDRSDHSSDYFSVNFYASVREGEQADLEYAALKESAALSDLRTARANGAIALELERMIAGHDIGGELVLGVSAPIRDEATLTDLNPLGDGERCVPGCPGWFVNSENGRPESCDECGNTAAARGLGAVTDDAAYEAWRKMLQTSLGRQSPESIAALLPDVP